MPFDITALMNDHRYIMEKLLSEGHFVPPFNFRKINQNDFLVLGQLLFEADLGTVEMKVSQLKTQLMKFKIL